mmetsp:Transcript_93892/g.268864  ORF Transcript_93892/g.268864 Transcript_93892/m.268864 type:complete len:256 (+) Transcript_93892:1037-1804(+)
MTAQTSSLVKPSLALRTIHVLARWPRVPSRAVAYEICAAALHLPTADRRVLRCPERGCLGTLGHLRARVRTIVVSAVALRAGLPATVAGMKSLVASAHPSRAVARTTVTARRALPCPNNACVGSVKRACEAVGIDAEVRGPCGTGQRARVDERWQIATEFAECDHRRDTGPSADATVASGDAHVDRHCRRELLEVILKQLGSCVVRNRVCGLALPSHVPAVIDVRCHVVTIVVGWRLCGSKRSSGERSSVPGTQA